MNPKILIIMWLMRRPTISMIRWDQFEDILKKETHLKGKEKNSKCHRRQNLTSVRHNRQHINVTYATQLFIKENLKLSTSKWPTVVTNSSVEFAAIKAKLSRVTTTIWCCMRTPICYLTCVISAVKITKKLASSDGISSSAILINPWEFPNFSVTSATSELSQKWMSNVT